MKYESQAWPMLLHGEHFHAIDQGEGIKAESRQFLHLEVEENLGVKEKKGIYNPQDRIIMKHVNT